MGKSVIECRTCRFWLSSDQTHRGLCHRYPDTVMKEGSSFCGEYQAVDLPSGMFPDGVTMKVKIPKAKTSKKKHVRKR